MKLGKTLSELCTPAFIYLAISLFAILVALFNGTKIIMVLGKTAFVVFWTFLLNLLCKNGYKSFSWFLVLLPYVLLLGGFLTAFYQVKETFADMGASDPTAVATELVSSLMKEKEDDDTKEGFSACGKGFRNSCSPCRSSTGQKACVPSCRCVRI
jgi:hypothetical protein